MEIQRHTYPSPADGVWIVSGLTIRNNTAGNICMEVLWMCISLLMNRFLEEELLGGMVSLHVTF